MFFFFLLASFTTLTLPCTLKTSKIFANKSIKKNQLKFFFFLSALHGRSCQQQVPTAVASATEDEEKLQSWLRHLRREQRIG